MGVISFVRAGADFAIARFGPIALFEETPASVTEFPLHMPIVSTSTVLSGMEIWNTATPKEAVRPLQCPCANDTTSLSNGEEKNVSLKESTSGYYIDSASYPIAVLDNLPIFAYEHSGRRLFYAVFARTNG